MLRKKTYWRPHRALGAQRDGKTSEHAVTSSFPVSAVGGTSEPAVISSFSAEVTAPLCPLRNATSTPESSGESHGTVIRTAQRMSSIHIVLVVPCGVDLVSRAPYISRKKRNRETCRRQSKALRRAQREAKRNFVAQPEIISHEAAEAILRSQAARTDEKFPGIIHVSHQFALLHGHENVFFCTQCGCRQRWWITEAAQVFVRIWRIPPESETQTWACFDAKRTCSMS